MKLETHNTLLISISVLLLSVVFVLYYIVQYSSFEDAIGCVYNRPYISIGLVLLWILSLVSSALIQYVKLRNLYEIPMKILSKDNAQLKNMIFISYHDLKSCVDDIGFSSNMLHQLPKNFHNNVDFTEALDMLKTAHTKQFSLINGIREWSTSLMKQDKIQFVAFNATEVVSVRKQGINNLVVGELGIVVANKNLFEILIDNLIDNGLQHNTNPSSDKWVSIFKEGDYIIIEDNGTGFNVREFDLMLKPFVKGSSSTGTGVGLSICKSICDLHNWKFSATSNKGTGSRFKIFVGKI